MNKYVTILMAVIAYVQSADTPIYDLDKMPQCSGDIPESDGPIKIIANDQSGSTGATWTVSQNTCDKSLKLRSQSIDYEDESNNVCADDQVGCKSKFVWIFDASSLPNG